jgi:predicted MPP superfamily phosphohydrolase
MRSAPIVLIFLTLSLLIDLYVYRLFFRWRKHKKPPVVGKRIFWYLNILAYLSVFGINLYGYDLADPAVRNIIIGGFGLLFFTKITLIPFLFIDDLLAAFQWIFKKMGILQQDVEPIQASGNGISRSEFISRMAVLTAALPFLSLGYGMLKGGYNYQLRRVRLKFPNLPRAFHGTTIVQLSDIHVGSFTSHQAVQKGIDLANAQNADYLVFTGDLVNNRTMEVNSWMGQLAELKAKHGIFSILGNHDYGDYFRWDDDSAKKQNMDHMYETHRKLGWHLLLNEHVVLERGGEKIALVGVENWGDRGRFPKYGRIDEALAGTENIPFKILLSHDPSHFETQVNGQYTDIDLTLSGHTHGMQFGVEIPGYFKWSPSSLLYPHWAGLYQFGKQFLYVNRGFGFIGYPGRVGILPEVTLITLESGKLEEGVESHEA